MKVRFSRCIPFHRLEDNKAQRHDEQISSGTEKNSFLQSSDDVMPSPEAYAPAVHALQMAETAAPDAVEYFPAEHSEHAPDAVSPDPVAYAPAKQRLHAPDDVAPDAVEYCPALHSDRHADLSPDADA
jgi:hypothetical protein